MPPRTSNRRPVPLSDAPSPPAALAEHGGVAGFENLHLRAKSIDFAGVLPELDTGWTAEYDAVNNAVELQAMLSAYHAFSMLRAPGVGPAVYEKGTASNLYFFYPIPDNVASLGISNTNRWRNAYIVALADVEQVFFDDKAAAPATTGLLQRNGTDLYYFDGTTAHKLNLATGYGAAGYPQDVADAEADGTAALIARSDHVHKLGILTTKGDLLAYSTLPVRVAVGTDNHVLVADSGSTPGVKWESRTAAADADLGTQVVDGAIFTTAQETNLNGLFANIVNDLNDLKAKMRTAELLAT